MEQYLPTLICLGGSLFLLFIAFVGILLFTEADPEQRFIDELPETEPEKNEGEIVRWSPVYDWQATRQWLEQERQQQLVAERAEREERRRAESLKIDQDFPLWLIQGEQRLPPMLWAGFNCVLYLP